jgi:enoyl-CoA hydratase/carnithine racemase
MPFVKTLPGMPPTPRFVDYQARYKDIFSMSRSEDGVLLIKWHEKGGTAPWTLLMHRAIPEMLKEAGRDVENEVFILGGTGGDFFQFQKIPPLPLNPNVAALAGFTNQPAQQDICEDPQSFFWLSYEHIYYDGCRLVESIVNDIEVPTIGVLNGSGIHSEIALLCDVTLMSDDATIMDPHMNLNWAAGDGIQIAFRMAMGYKRSVYALMTGQQIDAETALKWGMVNEVLPKEKLYDRAQELARSFASRDRMVRRVNTQILRAPLRREILEVRGTLGSELFAKLAAHNQHFGKWPGK